MKKILVFTIPLLTFTFLAPLSPAQADLVCERGECQFVFDKSERLEKWTVPLGVNEVEFEIYGAQGGGGGGLGGFVSGTLINLPEELTIAVGGAGLRGAYSPGGFNGGGASGGVYANPGSGGGASDIRIGLELTDRIAVAGGGGGVGGPSGGNGGDGGGLVASDGSAGQGGAGAGGSQLSGGAGGRSNAADINGQNGQLGIGGNGGEDAIAAGGAGGGGGYFGGGGSGADTDPCCLDAGGGGGGSSYADPQYTKDVEYQPGINAGHGRVILRYQLPAAITTFDYKQLSPKSLEASIIFDRGVSGVALSDFQIEGCELAEIGGEDTKFFLRLSDCQQLGTVTIPANSFGDDLDTPTADMNLYFELDQQAPKVDFDYQTLVNTPEFQIVVETDSSGIFDEQAVTSPSCLMDFRYLENRLVIDAHECTEGQATTEFDIGFLSDEIGNHSLAERKQIIVLVDTIAPEVAEFENKIVEAEIGNAIKIETTTVFSFSETVTRSPEFSFSGPAECETLTEVTETGGRLKTLGCPLGTVTWTLLAGELEDLAENSGPMQNWQVKIEIPEVSSTGPEPDRFSNETNPVPTESELVETPLPEDAPTHGEGDSNELVEKVTEGESEIRPPELEFDLPNDEIALENSEAEDSGKNDLGQGEPQDSDVKADPGDKVTYEVLDLTSSLANVDGNDTRNQEVSLVSIALAVIFVTGLLIAVLMLTKNNRSGTVK